MGIDGGYAVAATAPDHDPLRQVSREVEGEGSLSHDDSPVMANPQHDERTRRRRQPSPSPRSCFGLNPYQLTAMISNFSTSYNVVNISLVLPILEHLHPPRNSEDAAASASSLLAGMMLGQVLGGALGDSRVGRLGALGIVMSLQVLASVASGLLGSDAGDIYLRLAACRFLLGIGAGGVYPLAAVLSAEYGSEEKPEEASNEAPKNSEQAALEECAAEADLRTRDDGAHREDEEEAKQVQRVVLTFSTQGLGFVAVPILAVFLFSVIDNLDVVWRIMLGVGALPGIVLMIFQWRLYLARRAAMDDSYSSLLVDEEAEPSNDVLADPTDATSSQDDEGRDGILRDAPTTGGFLHAIRNEPGLGSKLIGTAGTWFLFDVLFYGNTLFQPIVIEAAFGNEGGSPEEMLRKTAIDSLILTSIALPGYFVAGALVGKRTCCITQTPRYVMMQGFAAMSVLYLTIGIQWEFLRQYPAALVTLYGSTFFFANYGPNTSTFLLPSLLYSPECRSTLNGISAAAGKFGALVGATLFAPAAEKWGDAVVMQLCATVAAVSLLVTYVFVPEHRR